MTHRPDRVRRWHGWKHPMFWKMLAADIVLIGVTALAFPGRTGERLLLMVVAIALASLVINVILTPPALFTPPATPRTEDRANDHARLLRSLRRSLQAMEAERASIAHDLRETTAQQLAGLAMHVSAAQRNNTDTAVGDSLHEACDVARSTARDLSGIADRIYPGWKGAFGLVSSLQALRRQVAARGSLEVQLTVHGIPFILAPPLTRALLRVAEEAVRNVETHADTPLVQLEVTFQSPKVGLEIIDNAAGFDLAILDGDHGGLGLFRARELLAHEGGSMQIESAPGCGTRVLATVNVLEGAAA